MLKGPKPVLLYKKMDKTSCFILHTEVKTLHNTTTDDGAASTEMMLWWHATVNTTWLLVNLQTASIPLSFQVLLHLLLFTLPKINMDMSAQYGSDHDVPALNRGDSKCMQIGMSLKGIHCSDTGLKFLQRHVFYVLLPGHVVTNAVLTWIPFTSGWKWPVWHAWSGFPRLHQRRYRWN